MFIVNLTLFLCYLLLAPEPAHAYFDPGIAAFIYQVGYGLITAALVLFISGPKRVWSYFKSFFVKKVPETSENVTDD